MTDALGLAAAPSVPPAGRRDGVAVVLGAVLIAAVPARRARNLRPAEVLRQE